MSNLTQIVNVEKDFKILKKVVHASDVDQILSSSGPFTFFAPSDLAFEKLAKGVVEDLLEPNNRQKLAEKLRNHIVSGKFPYKLLKDGDTLTSVNGKKLVIQVKDGVVSIDDIVVQSREAKISNGIMHTMDTLLQ